MPLLVLGICGIIHKVCGIISGIISGIIHGTPGSCGIIHGTLWGLLGDPFRGTLGAPRAGHPSHILQWPRGFLSSAQGGLGGPCEGILGVSIGFGGAVGTWWELSRGWGFCGVSWGGAL